MNNGNMNNNNVNNRYVAAGASDLSLLHDEVFAAEVECYKNKHDSIPAAKVHYHLSDVQKLYEDLVRGTWKEGTSIVFAISYPTYREVWAAEYTDRILHHMVAPLMSQACENMHMRNGDVSHGNRPKHSAHTAAMQIQSYMNDHPAWWVGKRDFSGFFMSINRSKAAKIVIDQMHECGLTIRHDWLVNELITHNPCDNCDIRSSPEEMAKIPRNKSQMYAEEGHALPIGNFYSQLAANLFLWKIDALAMSDKWNGRIFYTRFVDDMCAVGCNPTTINEFFDDVEKLSIDLDLHIHKDKVYMQPVSHGVSFCGRTIHAHGIYINNRTIRACKEKVRCSTDREDEIQLIRSLNSYGGFFKHCKAFNIQKRIEDVVKRNHVNRITTEYRGFKNKTQIVYHLADHLTDRAISKKYISSFLKIVKNEGRKIRKRKFIRKIYQRRRSCIAHQ